MIGRDYTARAPKRPQARMTVDSDGTIQLPRGVRFVTKRQTWWLESKLNAAAERLPVIRPALAKLPIFLQRQAD